MREASCTRKAVGYAFEGARTFAREFTHSSIGPLPPNGQRIVFELVNIFRHDDAGRLADEMIQSDSRIVLRQLGTEGH